MGHVPYPHPPTGHGHGLTGHGTGLTGHGPLVGKYELLPIRSKLTGEIEWIPVFIK